MVSAPFCTRRWGLLFIMAASCVGGSVVNTVVAAGPFDGTYRGTQRSTLSNNSSSCSRIDRSASIVIQNSHFNRIWSPGSLSVEVAADGSCSAKTEVGKGRNTGTPRLLKINGQVAGNDLEADIGTDRCAAHLSLRKS